MKLLKKKVYDFCEYTNYQVVASKVDMEVHMQKHHPTGEEYWCDQCNYTFLTAKLLGGHNKKYHASQGDKKGRYLVKKDIL